MTSKSETTLRHVDTPRIVWLVSVVIPLVLVALLCVARPADAAVVGPPAPPPELEEEFEEEPEEEPEEECEEVEEGLVECEEAEAAGEQTGPYPPAECLLRTARARVFTYTSRDELRLVVRYTSVAPAKVYVDFRLKSSKGSLKLGLVKRRFSKRGLFRLNESLSDARMERVRAAKRFVVTLDIPAAPSYCHRYYTRRLTIKKTVHGQAVWFQSDSIFGT
jgi:hypothetical protein